MNWAALITQLLTVFGPFLLQLLQSLFKTAAPTLTGDPNSLTPEVAVATAFTAARAKIRWYNPLHWGATAKLAVAERIATKHAAAIVAAAKGTGPLPALTADDQSALLAA